MIYCFDIDGTLCSQYPESGDYSESTPIAERITVVNKLYDEGHKILLLTARGMGRTDNDQIGAYKCLYTFTENQLKEWGSNTISFLWESQRLIFSLTIRE